MWLADQISALMSRWTGQCPYALKSLLSPDLCANHVWMMGKAQLPNLYQQNMVVFSAPSHHHRPLSITWPAEDYEAVYQRRHAAGAPYNTPGVTERQTHLHMSFSDFHIQPAPAVDCASFKGSPAAAKGHWDMTNVRNCSVYAAIISERPQLCWECVNTVQITTFHGCLWIASTARR